MFQRNYQSHCHGQFETELHDQDTIGKASASTTTRAMQCSEDGRVEPEHQTLTAARKLEKQVRIHEIDHGVIIHDPTNFHCQ